MPDEVTVRPFRTDDLNDVLEVLRLALGETPLLQRTPELFEWKHFHNPFGQSILLVAEAEGRVVGVRAFMRWELATPEGRVLRCVRPVDTATHPGFQRRGIFRRLTMEAVERARDDGVDLIFNTPNRRSGTGYLSMGWREIGRIGVMVRPSLRLVHPNSTRSGPVLTGANLGGGAALEAVDAHETRTPLGLRTPRSSDYLEWRFSRHPTAGYVAVAVSGGVVVARANTRRGRSELVISDVFGPRRRSALLETGRRSRADYGVAWFSGGSPERRAAALAGFTPVPGVRALTLMALPLTEVPDELMTLRSWDISLSDLELL